MNRKDNSFIVFLSLAVLLLTGIIAQNVAAVLKPQPAQPAIDVGKVKHDLEAAGLTPREAMHWKEL